MDGQPNWVIPDRIGTIAILLSAGFLLLDLAFFYWYLLVLAVMFGIISLIFKIVALYRCRNERKR